MEISQYVIKTININNNAKFKEYKNELYVGPKMYAFLMNKYLRQGEYIMDYLFEFTNGYHGDLHLDNVMVYIDSRMIEKKYYIYQ